MATVALLIFFPQPPPADANVQMRYIVSMMIKYSKGKWIVTHVVS